MIRNTNPNLINQPRPVAGLLASTLGFAAYGLMQQLTVRRVEGWAYPDPIKAYWVSLALALVGCLILFGLVYRICRRCPLVLRTAQRLLLVVLLAVAVRATVSALSDFSAASNIIRLMDSNGTTHFSRNKVVWDALRSCQLIGSASPAAEDLVYFESTFWRWVQDNVLTVLSMYNGLWCLAAYFVLAAAWLFFAVRCGCRIVGNEEWALHIGGNRIFGIDLHKAVYDITAFAVLLRILGPIASLFGLFRYSGGIPFGNTNARGIGADLLFVMILCIGCLPGQIPLFPDHKRSGKRMSINEEVRE